MAYKYIRAFTENGLSGLGMDDVSKNLNHEFIKDKIEYFKDYNNYSSKKELLNLFNEIKEKIEDDDNNAIFEFNGLENVLGDINQAKRLTILNYHLGKTLGYIFLNVFDYEKNRMKKLEDGFVGAISLCEVLAYGITEFLRKKEQAVQEQKPTHAYGANFIFISVFEEELKLHIERYYSKKYLLDLMKKINDGSVVLNDEEDKLFDYLCNRVEITTSRRYEIQYDSIYATGKKQYDLLNKYTDIANESSIEKLYSGSETLNKLRTKTYFTNIVDDRFTNILIYLFANNNLNLRNNLAHGNLPYFDYHDLGYTAILYVLIIMVSNDHFLKDNIN